MAELLILLALPEEVRHTYRDRLLEAFPELTINVVDHRGKVAPHIATADILLTFTPMMSDEVLRAASRLKWIQTLGTGVDNLIDLPSLRPDTIVTNVHGIHGAPVSEAVLAAMLALSRQLPGFVRSQDRHQWTKWPVRLLDRKTVGIFGIGVIAEALAPKCKAMGMTVVGISASPRQVAGFDRVVGRDRLAEAVAGLDYFVLLTPLTPQTRGIVDGRVLAAHEADRLPGQFRARRCGRRAGLARYPPGQENRRRRARCIRRGAAAIRAPVLVARQRHHHTAPGRVLRCLSRPGAADRYNQHAVFPFRKRCRHDQRGQARTRSLTCSCPNA
jgi:hypothetical protein